MSIRKGTTIIAGNSSPLDWTGTLQEYNIALENGTIKENMVCYITDDTLYTDDIRPEIETLNSVKANKDLSNLSEVGEKHFLNKSQITNCITEVPQRIKYTLENGILTIKAGSVVIVPYGVEDLTSQYPKGATFLNDNFKVYDTQFEDGKFFVWAELVSDIAYSQAWQTAEGGLASVVMDNRFLGATYNRHHSGDISSIQTAGISFLYDLTTNKITRYVSKVMDGEYCSFPVMETVSIISNTPTINVINQVFNGIGYIGSRIWVDKGVKGLVPNGRNEDGSLRNKEIVLNHLKETNCASTEPLVGGFRGLFVSNNSTSVWMPHSMLILSGFDREKPKTLPKAHHSVYYAIDTNYIYESPAVENITTERSWGLTTDRLFVGIYSANSNPVAVTSLKPKRPTTILTEDRKNDIAGWGMSSSRYVDLTLGASGTTYTAPANGWYSVDLISVSTSSFGEFYKNGVRIAHRVHSVSNQSIPFYAPFRKGDILDIKYGNATLSHFRFYYAEGET